MTIKEFLQKQSNIILAKNVPSGRAQTPEELYNNCITVPCPNSSNNPNSDMITNAIIGWHELLVWYAKQPGAVLLSRLYESATSKDGTWNNRRNSLTISGNYKYTFCSNWFARVIMTMTLNGYVPDKQDFWDMMVTDREFYLGIPFGMTEIEKRISAYPNKPYANKFYTLGWYLAHIVAVEDMPYKGYPHPGIENIFKLGEEKDWHFDATYGCIVRKNDDMLTCEQKKIAIAHFLRCVDPLNYFLVPNKHNVIYKKINNSDGSPLGENKFVVQYMLIKAYERFGAIFEDFLNLSLADVDIKTLSASKAKIAQTTINAVYGPNINKTKNDAAAKIKPTSDASMMSVSKKPRNKYAFDGAGEYSQRGVLSELVKKYVEEHPAADITDLKSVFELNLKFNHKAIVLTTTETDPKTKKGETKILSDDTIVYINNQVSSDDMPGIIRIANGLHHTITKI